MYRDDYGNYCIAGKSEHQNRLLALWSAATSTVRIEWITLKLSASVTQERKALSKLPDHLLHDIGITRAEADAESNKKGNDLPIDRLRRE